MQKWPPELTSPPHSEQIFFLVIRTFKTYSLGNFQIYSTVLLTIYSHYPIHYIPRTYLFWNWKFVLFDITCNDFGFFTSQSKISGIWKTSTFFQHLSYICKLNVYTITPSFVLLKRINLGHIQFKHALKCPNASVILNLGCL